MNAIPNLPNLTPDERIWRVDWFGDCGYPGTVRRYAQPSVRVVLSALRCDPSDQIALLAPEATDHQHSHQAWVPVAALPMLAIGDLWQAGHHMASPDYQRESFGKLRIDLETASFIKAGLAIDDHFLIPLSNHPWHRLHTQSYCVSISMADGRRLLVPCMEIIRFYFGSSSNLLQRLFTNPLVVCTLWTSKRLDPATKHLHLVLANRLSGVSASDIGRVAVDPLAWRSAAGIHSSCQKASVQRQPVYPYTGFPFEGETDLLASGIWLPFGEDNNTTFLVYRLHSCSHPFPFKSLSYEASDRKAIYDSKSKQGDKPDSVSKGSAMRETKSVDQDPDAKKAINSPRIQTNHRFPDLLRKLVWREKLEAMPKSDVFLLKKDGGLEQVAFGEGHGQSGSTGVDVLVGATSDENETTTRLPAFVKRGLKLIADLPEFAGEKPELKLVCLPGKTQPVFSLPVVIDEDGVIDGGQKITEQHGRTRQRQGCFVDVSKVVRERHWMVILEGATYGVLPAVHPTARLDVSALLAMLWHNHPWI